MVNTSVKIGKLTLRNPVVTGSGTFGFGPEMAGIVDLNKIGACVVKSTSREPRLGNPTPRIVETPSGILNAIGLQNGGVDNFIAEKLPFLRQFDVPIIVNLVGYEVADYVYLAEKLTEAGGVHGLEINISCPNVKHGCDFAVDPALTAELIARSPQSHRPDADYQALAECHRHGSHRPRRRGRRLGRAFAHQHPARHGH